MIPRSLTLSGVKDRGAWLSGVNDIAETACSIFFNIAVKYLQESFLLMNQRDHLKNRVKNFMKHLYKINFKMIEKLQKMFWLPRAIFTPASDSADFCTCKYLGKIETIFKNTLAENKGTKLERFMKKRPKVFLNKWLFSICKRASRFQF